ncbi:MAG: hypothetical protein KA248_11930 [Kiritimatiellae bacterium]|nr:hypothetical protein [Kiritimatiellia bacterium]
MSANPVRRLLAALICSWPGLAAAQVPGLVNYQGRLLNGTNLYSGTISPIFRLYVLPAGGLQIYIEQDVNVPVADGFYSTLLGDNPVGTPLAVALTNNPVYLEVEIGGVRLSPRERIVSGGRPLGPLAYRGGDAFVVVSVTNNEAVNALNLLAACTAATNLRPHGLPLSAVNRAVVLVPPGRYHLGTDQLTLSCDFVDLVGLSSAREDQHIRGASDGDNTGVLRQTADNVRIENLFVECTRAGGGTGGDSADPAAYVPDSSLSNTVVRNCRFKAVGEDASWSMRLGVDYAGIYENCVAEDYAFGGGQFGRASGLFVECDGGDFSFGSGFSAQASGRFRRCTGGNGSFGAFFGTASGTFEDCTGGVGSFGGVNASASGTFIRCAGEENSFGALGGSAGGVFLHCWMKGTNWTGGQLSGRMEGCRWEAPVIAALSGRVFRSVIEGVFRDDSYFEIGEASVTVKPCRDEELNGRNLLAAYVLATNLWPHGQARSGSNRVALLVSPGVYNLGSEALQLTGEHVDVVGVSSARDDQRLVGSADVDYFGVILQSASDVRIENLFVECTRSNGIAGGDFNDPAAYFPESGLSNTVIRNCRFKANDTNAWAMRCEVEYAGTYEDCVGGENSFGGPGGRASGVFRRCEGGDSSFGFSVGAEASGTFEDCAGGDASFGAFTDARGTFDRCAGGNFAFGGSGYATGTYRNCRSGGAGFGGWGGIAGGTFLHCIGGDTCFGSRAGMASGFFLNCVAEDDSFGSHLGSYASGTFINCHAGAMSFGMDGHCSGTFINCRGGLRSFGGNDDDITGSLFHCWMDSDTWRGQFGGRMEGCRWGAGIMVADGAVIYDSTVAGAVTNSGSGSCRIAHVRCQALDLGPMVNAIATPYNVVDADVE